MYTKDGGKRGSSMLGSWFPAEKSESARDLPSTSQKHTPVQKAADTPLRNTPNLPPPTHDEILAEMYGRRHRAEMTTTNVEGTPGIPIVAANIGNSEDSPPPASTTPTYITNTSTSASATAPISRLYDPFSGAPLGILAPPDNDLHPLSDAGGKDEELWSHLQGILKLQSEIAEMHLQMGDIGTDAGQRRSGWAAGDEAVEGADEDEGLEWDEEAERDKAREDKFAKLADTFVGRRQKIDQVMDKLGTLSQALTTFHALRTPTFDFSPSRGSTHPTSPNTRSPTRNDTQTSDIHTKPPYIKTYSTPQLLSPKRPHPVHSHSQPGSPRSAVPSLSGRQPHNILRQPIVESPTSMAGTLPKE